jgi:hypothetical protein
MNPTWKWTVRRLLISAFIILHIAATLVWNIPNCPIRARFLDTASRYFYPLGLWQYWAMFAPDPLRETVTLEAVVTDQQGLRYGFAFPKLAQEPRWKVVPKFRHPKYILYVSTDEMLRKFAARHVVRQLGLTADTFPLDVQLYYQVRQAPPPGHLADPMAPTQPQLVGNFRFASLGEVRR